MARVKSSSSIFERIDSYLAYLFSAWGGIPELAREWPHWDEGSQLTFALNWSVKEDRLQSLKQWAVSGDMTPKQCERYQALLTLVAEQRPTLERLLAD